jgi:hypothetical protein
MGFGLSSITNAVKNAVNTVSDAAHKVQEGAKAVEEKVGGAVKGAWESVTGHDGFDDHPHGPLAESKPKGGSGSSSSYA